MKNIIGNNILKIRRQQKLTQEDLAVYLGVSREQISNYERGTRSISVEDLERLSDLFGIDLSDLFEENFDLQNMNLAFAFRSCNSKEDLQHIASFKKVVMTYIKMKSLNETKN